MNLKCEQDIFQSLLQELSVWLVNGHLSVKSDISPKEIARQGKLPAISLDGTYQAFLRELESLEPEPLGVTHPQGLGARIIPPPLVKSHLKKVKAYLAGCTHGEELKHRQLFIKQCVSQNLTGFIELPLFVSEPMVAGLKVDPLPEQVGFFLRLWLWFKNLFDSPVEEELPRAPVVEPWKDYGEASGDRGQFLRRTLTRQIEAALASPQASVNLGNYRHPLVTDALAQYIVQTQKKQRPKLVHITHSDGSTGEPFPLFVSPPYPDSWKADRTLHVGLISMRHLPLDDEIDFYWFTNLEVPARGAGAEADRYCHQASMRKLEGLRKRYSGERLEIYLYHTGFLPAVTGFYRAVADTLKPAGSSRKSADWLRVVPVFGPKDNPTASDSFGFPWPARLAEHQSCGVEKWVSGGTPNA
ncbi:MAG: hypothetical protein KDA84_05760 [Planctomycetaceae bacterium]|nr:hypothetical protein [Planctomycetaceae bacterium]